MICSGGKRTRMEHFQLNHFIALSQGASNPLSRPELFGHLGSQLELASLVGRRLGAGCSPLTVLKRFDWNIPNRCFLCKNEEETIDHLLLFCEKTRMLWLLILSLFGVQWVMHSSVKRNLLGWHGSFVGKKREKAWRAAPLCLMWTIWKERNRRAFDDIERNNKDIKSIFLYTFVN